jgi:hypothetical protein
MKRTPLWLAAALALLMLAMGLKDQLLTLPAVRQTAAHGQFDTNRAMARLRRILADERPHIVDSAANDAVRARLIAELRAIGLDPQVSDGVTCNSKSGTRTVNCARIRNVTATIGPPEGRHVLFVSHYDSAAVAPGASDDGIGMAAMLETAAQLRGRPLARPVTFLFDEGEEAGLIGARAFLDRSPIAPRVDTLVNLESRGVEGPGIMFETSRPNAPAIELFARAAERPVANSLTTDFYRMVPNSTDVTVFQERDWTILNFAVIGNETRYHSPGDTLAAMDLRSLQHMGDQALSLAQMLGSGESPRANGQSLYTDIAGRFLIVLPALAGFILLGLLILFFAGLGWRRRRGLGLAVLLVVAAIADAALLAWLAQKLLGLLREGDYWRGYPKATGIAVYVSALASSLAALALVRRTGTDRLRAAFWLVFLLLGATISFVAPGAAILFLLPPLAVAAGIALERWASGAERVGAIAAALILFITFGAVLDLIETLLSYGAAWSYAAVAAIILLPALIELVPLLRRASMKPILAPAAVVTLAAWTVVGFVPAYSEDRQQLFTVEYLWDETGRRGRWMVDNDGASLPKGFTAAARWQRNVEVPYSTRRRWAAAAPAVRVPAPTAEILSQPSVPEGRRVSLRLRTSGATTISLRAPAQARLRAVSVIGSSRTFGSEEVDSPYTLRCRGRSCDGMVVELLIGSREPQEWTVIGTHAALPQAAQPLLAARPRFSRPQYNPDGSYAVVRLRI